MYEVENLLITFCEIKEAAKGNAVQRRKASIKSVDSSEAFNWSYLLYITNIDKESKSVEKLEQHQYSVISLGVAEQILDFFMEFREEGKKSFEVIFRYTARKKLNDGKLQPEFTLEHRECLNVLVLCPFVLTTEWITPDPNINCDNAHFYFIGQPKTHLGINKKAVLNGKISAGSFPKVDIYGVALKPKDDSVADCTSELTNWKRWPVTLSEYESLSISFLMLPLKLFNDQQVADIEILWNRNKGSETERFICSIPLPPVSAIESCIEVAIASAPPRARKFREFFVDYAIRNTTGSIIEIRVKVGESPHFYLAGEIESKIILPPHEAEHIKFGLVPLRCGKFDLPDIYISMIVMGGMSEPIINNNFKYSIYVFPN
eukprot:TRINITY_DN14183_c0_g1_i1.p1 TRINITY_DN14183_c0_g1~~TRINITY_DN14183_c0_g1_i1.p1  ORF type:complete len:375 (+),score=103.30 TRINITY_DN14183_c0_g1_i1:353-1477(+)